MGRPLVAADTPLRVALLVSESDDRLRYLLEEDHNRGRAYQLVGAVANVADGAAASRLEAAGVPVTRLDIHDYYDDRGADLGDMDVREEFDARVADELAAFDPDLVVLSGYLHVLTRPVLDRFHPRLVNAHHADLTVRDEMGRPRFPGLHSVRDAIRAGEAATHETTHIVTEEVDRGPLLARSPPFPVHRDLVEDALAHGDEAVLDAYVYAHRRWMLREGGGPTLAKTIELVADGRVTVEDGTVRVDGEESVYQVQPPRVPRDPPLGDDA